MVYLVRLNIESETPLVDKREVEFAHLFHKVLRQRFFKVESVVLDDLQVCFKVDRRKVGTEPG